MDEAVQGGAEVLFQSATPEGPGNYFPVTVRAESSGLRCGMLEANSLLRVGGGRLGFLADGGEVRKSH